MTRDTNQLIAELTQDDKRIVPARSPLGAFLTYALGAVAYILLLTLHFHLRPDLAQKVMQPLFAAELGSLILVLLSTAWAATLLAYPDQYQKGLVIILPLIAFGLFVVAMVLAWLADRPPSPPPPHNMECLLCITGLSIPPALWLFTRIRKMATTQPMSAGAVALLAAFSIGALSLRLSEPTDSIRHVVFWHYLPMIGIGAIGLWLGKKIFHW